MGKGRHYGGHQKKIIERYYEHRDTIMIQRLGEIVSELYLCESQKKADSLWKRAAEALAKTNADPKRVAPVLEKRSVEQLAALVNELG